MVLLAHYDSLTGENAKYSSGNSATNQSRPRKANSQRELPRLAGLGEPRFINRAKGRNSWGPEHSSEPGQWRFCNSLPDAHACPTYCKDPIHLASVIFISFSP